MPFGEFGAGSLALRAGMKVRTLLDYGGVADCPAPTNLNPSPDTTGATDNGAAFTAADADLTAGTVAAVLVPPAPRGFAYATSKRLVVPRFGELFGFAWQSCIVLANNTVLGASNTAAFGAGMIELADDHVAGGSIRNLWLCGNKRNQIGGLGSAASPCTLASDITSVATTITLTTGHGAQLTAGGLGASTTFFIRINHEWIRCTGITGDVITVPGTNGRGMQNTTAAAHTAGTSVQLVIDGPFLDNARSVATDFPATDADHRVHDIIVTQFSGNGLWVFGDSANQFSRGAICAEIKIHGCDGNGMREEASDSTFNGIHVGGSGRVGIYAGGSSNRWGTTKAYTSGSLIGGSTLPGGGANTERDPVHCHNWWIAGSKSDFDGCQGQDGNGHNFYVTGNQNNIKVTPEACGAGVLPVASESGVIDTSSNRTITIATGYTTEGFAASGTFYAYTTETAAPVAVTYTGLTSTTFTGCNVASGTLTLTASSLIGAPFACNIMLDGAFDNEIKLASFDRHPAGANGFASGQNASTQFAVGIANGALRNTVTGRTRGMGIGEVSGDPSGNTIRLNGDGGIQTFGTTNGTFTPAVNKGSTITMTLNGNVTIAAPVNANLFQANASNVNGACYKGQELEFIFLQDGTGGRTVTFNSVFKVNWTPDTTASKRNSIRFRCVDGTNWVQTASVVGI